MSNLDVATVTFADFSPYLNSVFTVDHPAGSWPFTLVSGAEKAGEPPSFLTRRAFSLIFNSPPGTHLKQGILNFSHPELGTVALFMVPLGPVDPLAGADSPMAYQVSFN